MLEEKIDKAAEGMKSFVGKVREHKAKIIGGGLVALGSAVGIGLAFKAGQASDNDSYMCLEESDIDEQYYDPDWEPDQDDSETTEIEVTVEEVED